MCLIRGSLFLFSLSFLLVAIAYGTTAIEVNSRTPDVPATLTSNAVDIIMANPTWQKSATAAQATLFAQSTPLWAQATAIMASAAGSATAWANQQTAFAATVKTWDNYQTALAVTTTAQARATAKP